MMLRMARPRFLAAAVATAATVAAALAGFAGARPVVDRIAATIDELAIPESEVRKAMAVSALTPEAGETGAAFRARVIDALIDQKLQYREALRFAPTPPEPAEVDAAMARLKERLRGAGRNPDAEFAAAGMTPDEVRGALERQIVVQNYLADRFRPIAVADEDRAREEYETRYVAERRAAGQPVEPFEKVLEEMRRRVQQRVYDEEVTKWMKEIRQKAAIAVYDPARPVPAGGAPVPLTAPRPVPTAAASTGPGVR
jgi:hypothetical protein